MVTAGWRRDDNDDFGEHDNWRISARYNLSQLASGWAIRAASGTGFRAPSLYEIAYNNGPFAYPPASGTPLLEEQSDGWEVALIGGISALAFEVIWFDQSIENEIIFDLAAYSGYLQSFGESESDGLEIVASLPLSDNWSIDGNVNAWDAVQQNGADRPYRPEETGRVSLTGKTQRYRRNSPRGTLEKPLGRSVHRSVRQRHSILRGNGLSRRDSHWRPAC